MGRWLYYSYAAGDRTVLERKCRTDCHIRGLLLIIPLRLYRQDHGKLPAALSELVPDYLPAIPVDPFDGKPFRYLPDKGVVYSVGSDTRDSGGSTELEELYNESPKRIQRWYTEDAVFSLAPWEITQARESP